MNHTLRMKKTCAQCPDCIKCRLTDEEERGVCARKKFPALFCVNCDQAEACRGLDENADPMVSVDTLLSGVRIIQGLEHVSAPTMAARAAIAAVVVAEETCDRTNMTPDKLAAAINRMLDKLPAEIHHGPRLHIKFEAAQ